LTASFDRRSISARSFFPPSEKRGSYDRPKHACTCTVQLWLPELAIYIRTTNVLLQTPSLIPHLFCFVCTKSILVQLNTNQTYLVFLFGNLSRYLHSFNMDTTSYVPTSSSNMLILLVLILFRYGSIAPASASIDAQFKYIHAISTLVFFKEILKCPLHFLLCLICYT
jgi:hypothetical protein